MRNLNTIGLNEINHQLNRLQDDQKLYSKEAACGSSVDLGIDPVFVNPTYGLHPLVGTSGRSLHTRRLANHNFYTPQPARSLNHCSTNANAMSTDFNYLNLYFNNKNKCNMIGSSNTLLTQSSRQANLKAVRQNSVSIEHLPQLPSLHSNPNVLAGQHVSNHFALPAQSIVSSSSLSHVSASARVKSQLNLASNRLTRDSLSVSCGNLLTKNALFGKEIDSKYIMDNVLKEVAKEHTETMLMLAQRESSLRMCLRTLDNDPIKSLQLATSTQDMVLLADVLRLVVSKK